MRIMIKEHIPVDELLYLGYADPAKEDDTHYTVSHIGIIHPAILLDDEAPYGPVIRELREKAGISRADLARTLLFPIDEVIRMEEGVRHLSTHELNLISNIFHVNRDALRKAHISYRRSSIEEELQKTHALFDRLKQEIAETIEHCDKACGNERFFVKPSKDEETYLIYDAAENSFVKDEDGVLFQFHSPLSALDAAYRLERGERIKITPSPEERERIRIRQETKQRYSCIKEGDRVYVYEGGYPDIDGADTLAAVFAADGKETILRDLSGDAERILQAEAIRMLQIEAPVKEATPPLSR